MFSLCPHLGGVSQGGSAGGGQPGGSGLAGGGVRSGWGGQVWLGGRGGQVWQGEGQPRYDNSRSYCYTAGSMPLAFTQEDFLVQIYFQNLKLQRNNEFYR